MGLPLVGREQVLARLEVCLRDHGALVVSGPSGVGRTRVLQEAARLASAAGREVETVTGTSTARQFLFGATTHLLPPRAPTEPHEALAAAIDGLERRANQTGLVLLVDDADLLDPASGTLVHHVVRLGACPTVVTTCSDVPTLPDVVVSLWADLGADRVPLHPLSREELGTLLEGALAGPVSADLETQVWELTHGFPLTLRELIRGARDTGHLWQDDTGRWRAEGPLPVTDRLTERVRTAMRRLPDDLAAGLAELAMAAPVPAGAAVAVVGGDRIASLHRAGVIEIDGDPPAATVRFAQPIWALALRDTAPAAATPGRAQRWAGAILTHGAGADGRLRAATLLADVGTRLDADLALEAAGEALARFDGEGAERLVRAAHPEQAPPSAAVVLGQALQMQGRHQEADATLADAVLHAPDDAHRSRAALARARNLHWALGDRESALDVLESASDTVASDTARGALEIEMALYHAVVGALDRAGQVAAQALERPDLEPGTELTGLVVRTLALSVQGRLAALLAQRDRALALAAELRGQQPLAEDQILLSEAHLWLLDDLDAAARLARSRHRPGSPIQGMWRATAGLWAFARGAVADAAKLLWEAVDELGRSDPFGNIDMVRSMHALACGRADDPEGMRAALETVDGAVAAREPRTRLWYRRACALERARAGALEDAGTEAFEAGTEAVAAGYATWGALALHDAALFGTADVAAVLNDLDAGTDVAAIGLFAAHANALEERDPTRLEEAAIELFRSGRLVSAAEAFAQAAVVAEDSDQRSRSRFRSAALVVQAQGAWLSTDGRSELTVSTRELQIAQRVAAEATNREIADELFLSYRTVENHLARLYRRSGLDGRDALRSALAPLLDVDHSTR